MRCCLLAAACVTVAVPAVAQAPSRSDSAAVILDVAQKLGREGRAGASRELLHYLSRRFPETRYARTADSILETMPARVSSPGHTGFVTFNTLYGAFLGLASAMALDPDAGEGAGAGILLGAPMGLFVSRAVARSSFRTSGQAGLASFSTVWGTWLGLGVQQVLDVGEEEFCSGTYCYSDESDTAPWAAMVVGGLAGIGIGWTVASKHEIRPGTSTLIAHAAFWGTWFGLSLGRAAGQENDGLIATMLVAGNSALLFALPAAKNWQPSSARVRWITAGGLAGGLAGLGLLGLVSGSGDEDGNWVIPAAGSALGLVIGAVATKHLRDPDVIGAASPSANSLLQWTDGLAFRLPIPEPAVFQARGADGTWKPVRGARVRLFDARF